MAHESQSRRPMKLTDFWRLFVSLEVLLKKAVQEMGRWFG